MAGFLFVRQVRRLPASAGGRPERFQAKWSPVRVEKTRQIKNLEPRFDSIETEMALAKLRECVCRGTLKPRLRA